MCWVCMSLVLNTGAPSEASPSKQGFHPCVFDMRENAAGNVSTCAEMRLTAMQAEKQPMRNAWPNSWEDR